MYLAMAQLLCIDTPSVWPASGEGKTARTKMTIREVEGSKTKAVHQGDEGGRDGERERESERERGVG